MPLAKHCGTVHVEEPVGTGHFVEGAQRVNGGAVRAYPSKQRRKYVLVCAAVEDSVGDVKTAVKLRQLAGLSVACGGVAGFHSATEFRCHAVTPQQVTHKAFRRNGVGFGQGVPIYHKHALCLDEVDDALFVFGTDGQVVLDDDCAAVHAKVLVLRFGFQQVDDVVHQVYKSQFALLGGVSPLSVPVSSVD